MAIILSLGEVLWDCFPDRERLGGAPLNFAVHARRLGHRVLLVSAVGNDERGENALRRLRLHRVDTRFVRTVSTPSTGRVTVTLGRGGEPSYVIHRPAAYDRLRAPSRATLAQLAPDAVVFGTLAAARPGPRAMLRETLAACPDAMRVYDVNLRSRCWNDALVSALLRQCSVIKMNEDEAVEVARLAGVPARPLERFCRELARRYELRAVCVTRGARGCALLTTSYVRHPGYAIQVADTVGAGDAFTASLVHGLVQRWPASRIAAFACRIGALVASREGAVPPWTASDAARLRRRRTTTRTT